MDRRGVEAAEAEAEGGTEAAETEAVEVGEEGEGEEGERPQQHASLELRGS